MAAGRGAWDDSRISSDRATEPRIRLLTKRELDVLRRVSSGERSREIAAELELSEATVKAHLHNIYRKLGVENRVAATLWYVERYSGPDGSD